MAAFDIPSLRTVDRDQDMLFMGPAPACYHCHHFNLFLDQTVGDALGAEASAKLRFSAAREFFRPIIAELVTRAGAHTTAEKLTLARQLFKAMGHGLLDIEGTPARGRATGTHLHYGSCWKEKYGRLVNCREPMDGVATGFAAAALEVAYGAAEGSMVGREATCVAMRQPLCTMELEQGPVAPFGVAIDKPTTLAKTQRPLPGLHDDQITTIANGLREFTAGVGGDDRGLVQAFGVYVTMHLTSYYSRITFDTAHTIEREAAESIGMAEELFRESGHVCVFNTFGGILLSPEWEGMVKAPSNDVHEVVLGCMAIARGLGFGHWLVHELEPNQRMVLRATSSYEAAYYLARHGVANRSREYFLQGAALGTVRLAHRVDWESKPQLTQSFYNDLFKGDMPWRAEQTKSLMCGDEYSEVVVSRT